MNLAKLLRKRASSFPAVWYSKLHSRSLGRDKIQAIKLKKGSVDNKMKVSFARKENIL